MKEVEIWKVYRHFKGNYYFVENIGLDSETQEKVVIYKALYDREDNQIWVRPEKTFLETIDANKEGNVTRQTHRFELVEELSENHLK